MTSNELISTPEKSSFPSPLPLLAEQVRRARRRENWFNIFKFVIGSFCLMLLVCGTTAVLHPNDALTAVLQQNNTANTGEFIFEVIGVFLLWSVGELFSVFFIVSLLFAVNYVIKFVLIFWPFILYFWAGVWAVRQRTLLSLVQTATETKTPLAEMIRAYASVCYSSMFRARLERFAVILEQGYSLDAAIAWDSGLFRYDVVSMLRLGGNDPATLRSMESTISEDRDSSPVRSMSIVRVAYFFAIIAPLCMVVTFIMVAIAPKFDAIFHDFDLNFPLLTTLVFQVSNYFVKYWFLFSPLIPLAVVLFTLFLIIQTGVVIWRPPFFRRMFREADSAKMLRILAIGLKQNLPFSHILQVYRYAVPSSYLQRKAIRIEKDVEKGLSWTESLRRQRIVSTAEASLLETAARTGNTPAVLQQLSSSKEQTQIRQDDLISKLIFIPCILTLALLIGIFAIAMFLPIVNLTTVLSN